MKSIIIHDYMIKDLKLKGFELLIYAVVNSFTQFNKVCFVKDKIFCSFLGCSRSQFFKARSSLINKGLLICIDEGFITYENKEYDMEFEELYRIAKTPWLD